MLTVNRSISIDVGNKNIKLNIRLLFILSQTLSPNSFTQNYESRINDLIIIILLTVLLFIVIDG